MDLLTQLNRAVNYVEENICNDLELSNVSKVTTYSSYHFGRLFYYIAEMPLSEYIRKRKLTLAGIELQNSDIKVIDLAMKYGYDNSDSFTRAFVKQHEVTPTAARQSGVFLKIFPPLTFQITIKGVQAMNWRIEEKEAFQVAGIERYFKNVMNPDETGEITAFWKDAHADGSCQRLIARVGRSELIGFGGYVEEQSDEFPYMIGLVAGTDCDTSGFQVVRVPSATWAVFRSDELDENPHGRELRILFRRAYTEWFSTSGYDRFPGPDLEIYGVTENGKYYEEAWIPVIKK